MMKILTGIPVVLILTANLRRAIVRNFAVIAMKSILFIRVGSKRSFNVANPHDGKTFMPFRKEGQYMDASGAWRWVDYAGARRRPDEEYVDITGAGESHMMRM